MIWSNDLHVVDVDDVCFASIEGFPDTCLKIKFKNGVLENLYFNSAEESRKAFKEIKEIMNRC